MIIIIFAMAMMQCKGEGRITPVKVRIRDSLMTTSVQFANGSHVSVSHHVEKEDLVVERNTGGSSAGSDFHIASRKR